MKLVSSLQLETIDLADRVAHEDATVVSLIEIHDLTLQDLQHCHCLRVQNDAQLLAVVHNSCFQNDGIAHRWCNRNADVH